MTVEEVIEWLNRDDNRLMDIFGLWAAGSRDDRWTAERLIAGGHIEALVDAYNDAANQPVAEERP